MSVVQFFSNESPSDCGYCHKSDTSIANGMWAFKLTLDDFEALTNRNWRRSGCYCYKPVMQQTCCPLYMIRCDALEFKISKHQKKVIKKVNKYLREGLSVHPSQSQETLQVPNEQVQPPLTELPKPHTHSPQSRTDCPQPHTDCPQPHTDCPQPHTDSLRPHTDSPQPCRDSLKPPQTNSPKPHRDSQKEDVKQVTKGIGADPSKPPAIKAKLLRMQRKQQKQSLGLSVPVHKQTQGIKEKGTQSLTELINECENPQNRHSLQLKLVRSFPSSSEFEATKLEEFEVYKKYQTTIHKDPPSKLLFDSFKRFLIDSPLVRDTNLGVELGSFHYQYILDGKIIAVEVMDITSTFISSKYFFYDPEFSFLNLGTYSGIRSIELIRALNRKLDSLKYYLMGYYIHSCQKMRYKAQFSPSHLLCPETYDWVPVEICLPKLETCKYSRLSEDSRSDTDLPRRDDYKETLCVHKRTLVKYRSIMSGRSRADADQVRLYCSLVGRNLMGSICLYRE